MTLEAGDGLAGVVGGCGSGGAHHGLLVVGGRYVDWDTIIVIDYTVKPIIVLLYILYSPLYTPLYTPFVAIYTPMYTRCTCIYTIHTPLNTLSTPKYTLTAP